MTWLIALGCLSAGTCVGFVLASVFATRAQHDIEAADWKVRG